MQSRVGIVGIFKTQFPQGVRRAGKLFHRRIGLIGLFAILFSKLSLHLVAGLLISLPVIVLEVGQVVLHESEGYKGLPDRLGCEPTRRHQHKACL